MLPLLAGAQQPCTTDARQVVEQSIVRCSSAPPMPALRCGVEELQRGTTVHEVVRRVAKLPEHLQRFGNQERDNVVEDTYRHLLNRGPDPAGMKSGAGLASRSGIAPLVDQLVDSEEYRQRFGDWTVPGSTVRYCAPGGRPR